jgi:hypothetical protein
MVKYIPRSERERIVRKQIFMECLISITLMLGAGIFLATNQQTCNPCNRHPHEGLPTKNPPLDPLPKEAESPEGGGDELEL